MITYTQFVTLFKRTLVELGYDPDEILLDYASRYDTFKMLMQMFPDSYSLDECVRDFIAEAGLETTRR